MPVLRGALGIQHKVGLQTERVARVGRELHVGHPVRAEDVHRLGEHIIVYQTYVMKVKATHPVIFKA